MALFEVHHYHHIATDSGTSDALARIEAKLAQLFTQGAEMANDVSQLNSALDAFDAKTTEESQEIKDAVAEVLAALNSGDQAAIDAATARVTAAADRVNSFSDDVRAFIPSTGGGENPPA